MLRESVFGIFVAVVGLHNAYSEHLQYALEDRNLHQLTVVVDPRQAPLQHAKDIWLQLALQDRNLTINLFINNSEPIINATSLSEFGHLLNSLPPSLNGLLYSNVLVASNATQPRSAMLVVAAGVRDDTTSEEKKRGNQDLIRKHIKVYTIWLEKNLSKEADLLIQLANTAGGNFQSVTTDYKMNLITKDNKLVSRNIRWPTDIESTSGLQTSAPVIDPAGLESVVILNNTGAQRRSGEYRADNTILNWKLNTPVTVELNEQSTLFTQPGQSVILYLEITNNYEQQLFFYYYCNTMYSEVVNIQPYWGWVKGGETVAVNVLLRVNDNLQAPYDTIQFTASGSYTVVKNIYLYFGTQVEDGNKPEVSYTVNGDCNYVGQPSLCEGTTWNLLATVKDRDSGLLKVTSLPKGLQLPSDFTVGTKDPINVRYTSTCCYPKVDLIATDLNGNQYRKSIDINDIWLSTGSIIAIVLGIILLLIIIIIIIILIRCFINRRKRRLSFGTGN